MRNNKKVELTGMRTFDNFFFYFSYFSVLFKRELNAGWEMFYLKAKSGPISFGGCQGETSGTLGFSEA